MSTSTSNYTNDLFKEGATLRIALLLHACSETQEKEILPFAKKIQSLGRYCKRYQDSTSGRGNPLEGIVQVFKGQGISQKLQARLQAFEKLIQEKNPDYEAFANKYLVENNRLLMPKTLSWQLVALTTFRAAAIASLFFFGGALKTMLKPFMYIFILPSAVYQLYRTSPFSILTKDLEDASKIIEGFLANIEADEKEKTEALISQIKGALETKRKVLQEKEDSSILSPWDSNELSDISNIAKTAFVAIACYTFTALACYALVSYASPSFLALLNIDLLRPRDLALIGATTAFAKKIFASHSIPIFRDMGLCTESEKHAIPFIKREISFLESLKR